MKVSTHPGQYTVINTNNEKTLKKCIRDLIYHDRLLTAMGLNKVKGIRQSCQIIST